MKNKIITILFLLLICSNLYSEDLDFEATTELLYEKVTEAFAENNNQPELPDLEELQLSLAFNPELYKELNLVEFNEAYQKILGVFIIYARVLNLYPDEFSYITNRVIKILEILVGKFEYLKEENENSWTLIVEGFSQVLEGGVDMFTAVGEFTQENRLEIAEATLSVASNKWELIAPEKRNAILEKLNQYRDSETSEEISKLVSDFLKEKNPKMEIEGI